MCTYAKKNKLRLSRTPNARTTTTKKIYINNQKKNYKKHDERL